MGWGAVVAAGIGLAGSAMMANEAGNAAYDAAKMADPFRDQRPRYQNMLNSYIDQGPNAVKDDPWFTQPLQYGQQAAERSASSRGFNNSGNILQDIAGLNQAALMDNYYKKLDLLSTLAGAKTGQPGAGAQSYMSGMNTTLGYQNQVIGGAADLGRRLWDYGAQNTNSAYSGYDANSAASAPGGDYFSKLGNTNTNNLSYLG